MKAHAAFAAAAALAAGPAAAQAASAPARFCAELQRVVRVAERDGGFVRLNYPGWRRPNLGFRTRCEADDDVNRKYWRCAQMKSPEWMRRQALAARIAACLPEARRIDRDEGRQTDFALPRTEIRVSDSEGWGPEAGLVVQIVVERVRED